MKFLNYKKALQIGLPALLIAGALSVSLFVKQVDAYFGTNDPIASTVNGVPVWVQGVSDNFSGATYSASYKIYSNQQVMFTTLTQTYHCDEPYGDPTSPWKVCAENPVNNYTSIALTPANNYTQIVTLSVTQANNLPCGSLQTDVFLPDANGNPQFILGSLHHTGKDLNDCAVSTPTPTPTSTPTPSVTPTPTPTPLNVVQCPSGSYAKIVNSNVICVAQKQEQHQEQIQNNQQKVDVTVNPTIQNTNNITVNNPTPAPSVVTVKVAGVSVVNQAPVSVKELPKTGLPLAAIGITSLLPFGSRLRKLGKKNQEETANSIWMKKHLS